MLQKAKTRAWSCISNPWVAVISKQCFEKRKDSSQIIKLISGDILLADPGEAVTAPANLSLGMERRTTSPLQPSASRTRTPATFHTHLTPCQTAWNSKCSSPAAWKQTQGKRRKRQSWRTCTCGKPAVCPQLAEQVVPRREDALGAAVGRPHGWASDGPALGPGEGWQIEVLTP